MKENENPACQGHRKPTEEATTTAKKSRFPQRWFCEECAAVHPLPHLTSRRLCGFRNCINVIPPKQTACGELHQLLLARECGRSRQENLYQSPLVPTGDWLFAERHRLRKTRQDLAQILYPIAGHRACSNALYYIEVGDLNVPPGWLPALAALGFSVLPEALLETTLSASWLVQAIEESFDPRTACIVTMAWFGLTEGRLQHWARERRLLPHCFLPALYFHGLIFTG